MIYFLKNDEDGSIRHKDGRYRRPPVFFGTVSWAVKFWKRKAWAVKAAERDGLQEYTVISVGPQDTVCSDGFVERGNDGG